MRACVVTSFDSPLVIQEIPTPEPGPGQVLARIEASGLCHTDIHAARGEWPVKPALPFVPGHEGVGIVERVGPGVADVLIGDRVAIPWLGYSCGTCGFCVSGRETLCESQQNTGFSIDGTHADYAVAQARHVVKVPSGMSPLEAAPLTCAGVTAYKAIKVSGIRPTQRAAIFGIGGLGHLALQYAQIFGADAVAVDVTEEKLGLARSLGARHVVNGAQTEPVAAIGALGGADAALVFAASAKALAQAYSSLRRGGRLVLVALPREDTMQLPVFSTVAGGLSVVGSVVGTRADLAEVFALHAAGRTKVTYDARKLDDINESIEDVLAGRVAARVVFRA